MNILPDVSVVSTVPKTHIDKLMEDMMYVMADKVYKECMDGEINHRIELSFDIGCVTIDVSKVGIKYKFVPSRTLKDFMEKAVKGENPLAARAEDVIQDKIMRVYKELI